MRQAVCEHCGARCLDPRARFCDRECYFAAARAGVFHDQTSGSAVDPTPDEIAAECLEIQATWSTKERNDRMRVDQRRIPFEIPRYAE